jgi:glycosyltransferase involved in cell wall biosynthesis
MNSDEEVLISCLCVTENRPAFIPWLLWCFDRQTWKHRELVIIDSSAEPCSVSGRDDVQVIAVPEGTSVAAKRNRALEEAAGEIITWFDDDDWQHPSKLSLLAEALTDETPFAGSRDGWFVDLIASRCVRYRTPKGRIAFNSAGFRKVAVESIAFREDIRRASDSHWMRLVAAQHRAAILKRDDLFFWLSHETNLSNPARKRHFTRDLQILKERVGAEAWGDTDAALASLRERLVPTKTTRKETRAEIESFNDCKQVNCETSKTKPAPNVGVVIKATVLDASFLDVMVRHMIHQAKYSFAEKMIVVDRPSAFTGKYQTRPQATYDELEQVLQRLLANRVIDEVREVDSTPAVRNEIIGRYFADDPERIPTHASSGGPIYPTLFALESMKSDYVVQMDADILFHTGASSWVSQAVEIMNQDPALWLMMTHPGPPAGPVGKSIGPPNSKRAIWDTDLSIWRFRHATTRYFLCDRRKLHHTLRRVPVGNGCAPLERCISEALERHRAFRGNLGDLKSWHLHVWSHDDPFPAWVASLTRAIEAGHFPASQGGKYDLHLDHPAVRCQWEDLLRRQIEPTTVSVTTGPMPSATVKPVIKSYNGNRSGDVTPLSVVIPVRDRNAHRLRNSLRSLNWQISGRPSQIIVVSHGSQQEIDEELAELCIEQSATLIKIGNPAQSWNKSLALNTGIRHTKFDVPLIMTMDADMILAPNFFSIVVERLFRDPPALVLCRISDLPPQVYLPPEADDLRQSFDALYTTTQLRPRYGSGGIQAASRTFFFKIRGYDEDLAWWGAMDGDILNRARLMGLAIEWIEDRTAMLHQWHPRKHSVLMRPDQIAEAKQAWRFNHALVKSRRQHLVRNPVSWGGG